MQKHGQHTKTETSNGMKYVIGIDEVGRGALAGPVAVGAVMMPASFSWGDFENLKDSKKLSKKKREEWFERVRTSDVLAFGVEMVDAKFIDTEGIMPACRLAAHRCLKKIEAKCTLHPTWELSSQVGVLLDKGLSVPPEWQQEQIVKGDETVPAIALASIVAKVTRDRYMSDCAKKYPEYEFEKNKGYGTKAHCASIKQNGHIPSFHRVTFLGNIMLKS